MKIFLLFSTQILALCGSVFSQQCPPSILRIQSPICDTPRNLRVNDMNCTTVKLSWKGNKEQQYVVEATGTDAGANTLFEAKEPAYSCDAGGNCAATISIKEGARLNWNVQAICNIKGAVIYSPKINGKEAWIPYCGAITSDSKEDIEKPATIKVYPNPTTGRLTVEYFSKTAGIIQLKIFDVNGKKVFEKSESAKGANNIYQLDLRVLSSGTYLLNLNNGNDIKQVKFVLLRN